MLSPALTHCCQYDRAAVAGGQLWRLATWYLPHWGAEHLLWDALTCAVLLWACHRLAVRGVAATLATGALAGSAALYFLQPGFACCRGLSGLATALVGLLGATLWRRARRAGHAPLAIASAGLLLGVAAKTGYELLAGQALFVDSAAAGFVPLPLVHLAGLLPGVACATIARPAAAVVGRSHQTAKQGSVAGRQGTVPAGVGTAHLR